MLNIGKFWAGKAAYYLALASGVEDYYTGPEEPAGRWFGHGAEALGSGGHRHPGGADDGSGRAGAGIGGAARLGARMPGFDLTFRAPKSVSVLYALGDPEHGDRGRWWRHTRPLVDAAVAHLERSACSTRRRVDGEITAFEGRGFVAAGFRHQTSRAGDPTLHTHVLVANMTRTADGRWGSRGWPGVVRARQDGRLPVPGETWRMRLTRRLGVAWGPVVNGCADVAGIPQGVIGEFSTRRAWIPSAWRNGAKWSAKAAQAALLDTRRAKTRGAPMRWSFGRSGLTGPPRSASARTGSPTCSTWGFVVSRISPVSVGCSRTWPVLAGRPSTPPRSAGPTCCVAWRPCSGRARTWG